MPGNPGAYFAGLKKRALEQGLDLNNDSLKQHIDMLKKRAVESKDPQERNRAKARAAGFQKVLKARGGGGGGGLLRAEDLMSLTGKTKPGLLRRRPNE